MNRVSVAQHLLIATGSIFATASCVVADAEEPVDEVSEAISDDAYAQRDDVYDFLVMDVCTKGGAHGAVDPTKLPHECHKRGSENWRNLTPVVTKGNSFELVREGDPLYYRNHNAYRTKKRGFAFGHSAWSSYPVQHGSSRRILLVKDHGEVPATKDEQFGVLSGAGLDGVSVRWIGTDDAFMLLTVSPKDYGYAVTKGNCGQGAPEKFYGYWHMPKSIATRTFDKVWTDIGVSKLFDGKHPSKVPDCDRITYGKVLNTAVHVKEFDYVGGMKLETIVHNKFSGESPHDGKAFERIYFTRQYGITRWEQWQRADHEGIVEKKRHTSYWSAQIAGPDAPSCSRPYAQPDSAGLHAGALSSSAETSYTQRFKTNGGWELFHLVDCEDFTGRIVSGADLATAYGTKKDVKWSLKEISSFLVAPGDAATTDKIPVPDQVASFFTDKKRPR